MQVSYIGPYIFDFNLNSYAYALNSKIMIKLSRYEELYREQVGFTYDSSK